MKDNKIHVDRITYSLYDQYGEINEYLEEWECLDYIKKNPNVWGINELDNEGNEIQEKAKYRIVRNCFEKIYIINKDNNTRITRYRLIDSNVIYED